MATLGQTQYYKRNVNGEDVYQAMAYGGNNPPGYNVVTPDEYKTAVTKRIADFNSGAVKQGGSGDWGNLAPLQKSLDDLNTGTGIHAPNYTDPSFAKFNPTGQPTEANYTEAEKARVANIPSNLGGTGQATSFQQGSGSSTAPDENVWAIQKQLGITADGIFGPQTKSAIMAFQQANGLKVDGIVGPITQAALQKAGTAPPTTSSTTTTSQPNSNITTPVANPNVSTAQKAPDDPTNQYNTTTRQLNPKYVNPNTGKTRQQEIDEINTKANADMATMLASYQEKVGTSVEVSNSEKLLEAVKKSFDETATPTKPNLTSTLEAKKAELGVGAKETELANVNNDLAKLDAEFNALSDKETNRQVSVLQINRRKSDEEIKYARAKADLNLKKNAIVNELNQKNTVIDTLMKYTQADYENAQQDYTTKFNKAITTINLLKNIDEMAKSDAEKKVDNARANAQLMMNTLKDKNVDFSKLDSSTSLAINQLETQANLPQGFIKFAMSTTDQPVISIGGEFTDTKGNRQVPIYTKNPSTGVVGVQTVVIGTDSGVVDKNADLDKDVQFAVAEFIKAKKEKGWRGIDPEMYQHYRQQIVSQYKEKGANELDAAIKAAKLNVDYGSQSDLAFKREG